MNEKIPCSLFAFEMNTQNVTSAAAEVSYLKVASSEFKSLRKTLGIKIMSFSPVLETLSHYCM